MNAWLCIWCCWCTQVMYFVSVPYKTIDKEKHGIPLMSHILPSGSISWFIFLLLFATSRCSINSQLLQKKVTPSGSRLCWTLCPTKKAEERPARDWPTSHCCSTWPSWWQCGIMCCHQRTWGSPLNIQQRLVLSTIWTVSKQEFGLAGRARGSVNGVWQLGL